jgi:hypothetical protein
MALSTKVALVFLAMVALATLPAICSAEEDVELAQAGDHVLAIHHGAHARKLLNLPCSNLCTLSKQQCCSNVCVDFLIDPNNCGGCGKECPKDVLCLFGMCGYAGKF